MPLSSPLFDATTPDLPPVRVGRRAVLGYLGAAAGATTLVLAGCKDDVEAAPTLTSKADVSLGTDDIGILQYLYALEQVAAAFYTKVLATPPANFNEQDNFQRIGQHKALHRDVLKATLVNRTSATPIRLLTLDFASIDFTQRSLPGTGTTKLGVLQAAQLFADLGVAAYNGIGSSIKSLEFLTLIGKIVSVSARHAAYLHDLVINGSFADTADPNGLDQAKDRAAVIAAIQPFVVNKLTLG